MDTETLTNSKDEVSDIHVDSLAYWLRTVMKHKLLSKEEEKKLAKQIELGNELARQNSFGLIYGLLLLLLQNIQD